ncbi:response regulator [Acidaminobacter sp. JC074]|uniref:response regulator n=1 Tax=Acidaminobacter sp. JC074 TaxID=2530199 RepID=UPI001F0FF19B|nr:response regulator [Acidaminobacter sp. JC074]MCH4888317.1 response regulator [Acidaminobacter sp. JC074]
MRFVIVDDDHKIIRIMESIIQSSSLGEVVGVCHEGRKAVQMVSDLEPDIVLIDLLMPEVDGIAIVSALQSLSKVPKCIMISQVTNKNMISKAYESGIEFFINKPINRNEVAKVIEKVTEKIDLETKFEIMGNMFRKNEKRVEKPKDDPMRAIKLIFSKLGIMGEKGTEDILAICNYMIENKQSTFDFKVKDICKELSDNPKAMEQRLRRAINKGLINLANIGIEDYMNEIFLAYSNSLYDFQNVKAEMDYIRGKRSSGGKISIRRFIENIILLK